MRRRRWQLLRLLHSDGLHRGDLLGGCRGYDVCFVHRGDLFGGWFFHVHALPSGELLGDGCRSFYMFSV